MQGILSYYNPDPISKLRDLFDAVLKE